MSLKYWRGGHTKHRILIHLVFTPKYRKRVLRGKIASRVKGLFYEACKINDWWIDELKVLSDHVHMVIQIQPRYSVSKVVQILKGGSSKVIREEFPGLEEFLWGESFWADGYFAESVGTVTYDKIKKYSRENEESMPR